MKHVRSFRVFEGNEVISEERRNFLNTFSVGGWRMEPNGKIYATAFNLSYLIKLKSLEGSPDEVFNYFYCNNNSLNTLKGAPKSVGESFYCESNQLTSLVGSPDYVGKTFSCSANKIDSLIGAPQTVLDDFKCSNNRLKSLVGSPKEIGGSFWCNDNELLSLEGAPEEIGFDFFCNRNLIESLEGSPKEIPGDFYCEYNRLSSLEGSPRRIGGAFNCEGNPLRSLKGSPDEIDGTFFCDLFRIPKGEWNMNGFFKIIEDPLKEKEAKDLILTLPHFSHENIQKEIDKNPAKMAIALKSVWKLPSFKETREHLVIPSGFEDDFETQSDLGDLGF